MIRRANTPAMPQPEARKFDSGLMPLIARGALLAGSFLLTTGVLGLDLEPHIAMHGFRVGEPAPRSLFAPFTFVYVNEEGTLALRRQRADAVGDVLTLDPKPAREAGARADQIFEAFHKARESWAAAGQTPLTVNPADLPFELSQESFKALSEEPQLADVRKNLELLFEQLYSKGLMDPEQKRTLLGAGRREILVPAPDNPKGLIKSIAAVPSTLEARASIDQILPENVKKKNQKGVLHELFEKLVTPNLLVNETETQARRLAAADSVKPLEETIQKDELVVQRGLLVSEEQKQKIDLIQKKTAQKETLKKLSGTALLVALAYGILFIYLACFEKRTFRSFKQLVLIQTVFLITVVLCKTMTLWPGSSAYLMPGALAPLTLVMLLNPRFGVPASMVMAVLLGPLANFAPDVMLAIFLSGVAGTFASLRVRKRVEFLRIGFVTGFAVFVVLFGVRLYQEFSAYESFQIASLGFVNGFLVTMPALFLLVAILEWVFNLATDITLLELSDLNHPLLRRMIIEAPGTYHHSLVVSRLAEAACEEIGANALLARVGAYFHDIGKIAKSEFFTENHAGRYPSRHEKITPTMSSLIIINHVKEGIELGRKHKLKESVLKFIPEHQGTGVVYYFFRKAQDQAAPGEIINPDDFRYPGPRPQSRETAVTLLADSVEAASRSLRDPSADSLRTLVRKIINDKFIDGQLDECNLTLRDLHRIQESFVRNLMAIFHTRVGYPEKPVSEESPDLFAGTPVPKVRLPSKF